tara:strand:+ start:5264 stop:7537 length:2274 start_codon:yes stop_codon:yes gene_type:complete
MKRKKRKVSFASKGEPITMSFTESFAAKGFEVDVEKGLFKNVAIITKGPALGHEMIIDDTTLKQVTNSINSMRSGIKSRLTHPEKGFFGPTTDAIEVMVGRAKNARVEGNKVVGDVQLGQYSKKTPRGDLWGYLTSIADEDPTLVGLSISFFPGEHEERKDEDDISLAPACRVDSVIGVDFVGSPAANPNGFLDNGDFTSRKEINMNPLLRRFLESLGLDAKADDAKALTYMKALKGQDAAVAKALLSEEDEPAEEENKEEESSEEESKEEESKEEENSEEEPKEEEDSEDNAESVSSKQKAVVLTADKKRRVAIKALAQKNGLSDKWAQGLCDRGVSVTNVLNLVTLAQEMAMVPVTVGPDRSKDSLAIAIEDGIMLRSGSPMLELDEKTGVAIRDEDGKIKLRKPHERGLQFRNLSLMGMGKQFLTQLGITGVEYMGPTEIVELLFHPQALQGRYGISALAQGTSNFPFILANVLHKTLRGAYAEAPTDWPKFCSRMTTPDYKQFSLVSLSEAQDLVQRYEGEGIDYGTVTENREVATLAEYDKGMRLTRRSFINDDLNAFRRIPVIMGQAAKRKEDDLAFAILTANAALGQDSIALFDAATHDNYVTAGAAPGITTLNTAAAKMATKRGINSASYLNIAPKTIIAPIALMGTIKQLMASSVAPGTNEGHSKNIWENKLEMVFNARLDTANSAGWYLSADPGLHDTIVVAFLDSEQTPITKQKVDFDTEDLLFAVRHSAVAKAIDYRGLFYNDGA